jgi:hypothetical protein
MIDYNAEPWMLVPFIIILYGFIKLCIYIENNNKTDKSKE